MCVFLFSQLDVLFKYNTMKTTLLIDGGLGRVITAIPALEKYVERNPDTYIITYFWTPILWGNKKLRNNIFDSSTKGNFDKIKTTKILKPEPYFNNDYLHGKISLADAWNQEINGDKETMGIPKLYVSHSDLNKVSALKKTYYSKIIAFQPFGSTAQIVDNKVIDTTLRSLNEKTTKEIVKRLKKENYGIFLITDKQIPFLNASDFIQYNASDIRELAAAISLCDYFVGIDSSGQHIARSLNIPGSVIMGGTNSTNISYPDYFHMINDDPNKTYMPYRIAEFDWYLSEIENDKVLDFSDTEIKQICNDIVKNIKKTKTHRSE